MGWPLYFGSPSNYVLQPRLPAHFGTGCAIIPAYLAWIGYFKTMRLSSQKFEASECFYKSYRGPYDKTLGDEFHLVSKEVESHKLAQNSFNSKEIKYFGAYYDDPARSKDQSKLRADIGFLLSTKSLPEQDRESLLKEFETKGFAYTQFEDANCLYDSFDFKWPRFIAYSLGAKKFYSELKSRFHQDSSLLNGVKEAPGFVALEVYSTDRIEFYFPLEKVGQFYLTKLDAPENKII